MDKLFYWTTDATQFRYTTRTLKDRKSKPFTVRKWAVTYENTTGSRSEISWQVKTDKEWKDQDDHIIAEGTEGERKHEIIEVEDSINAEEFSLRITALPPNIQIHKIEVLIDDKTFEETPSE